MTKIYTATYTPQRNVKKEKDFRVIENHKIMVYEFTPPLIHDGISYNYKLINSSLVFPASDLKDLKLQAEFPWSN